MAMKIRAKDSVEAGETISRFDLPDWDMIRKQRCIALSLNSERVNGEKKKPPK